MNVLIVNCSPVRNGATAEIVKTIQAFMSVSHQVQSICIDDFSIAFCRGCRSCHETAKCVIQDDDVGRVMDLFEWADAVISVSPSYWADIPGQFKAFIDRCTPWCDTHQPHAVISQGKKGYVLALRTGPGMRELNRIIESIEHFYGHLGIRFSGSLGLCSVERREDVTERIAEILNFCGEIEEG